MGTNIYMASYPHVPRIRRRRYEDEGIEGAAKQGSPAPSTPTATTLQQQQQVRVRMSKAAQLATVTAPSAISVAVIWKRLGRVENGVVHCTSIILWLYLF